MINHDMGNILIPSIIPGNIPSKFPAIFSNFPLSNFVKIVHKYPDKHAKEARKARGAEVSHASAVKADEVRVLAGAHLHSMSARNGLRAPDFIGLADMLAGEAWRGGVARSPSHESVTTDLSLFSVSSAASDARVLRLLACKAGQGPDPSQRVASPNPDSKAIKRPSSALPLGTTDACRELLAGCAALCAQLGLRRSFSAGDVTASNTVHSVRSATSEVGLCAALEALTLSAASRSCSTWVAVGGSQLPSPQRSHPQPTHRGLPNDNKKVRQNYIKRRLLTTYRALERMSQSEFNLDRLEAAAVSAVTAAAGPGPTTLLVPGAGAGAGAGRHARLVHPEAAHLALTAADLERERGRPLSKYERNMMIFNWLHTLDEAQPF